MFLDYPEAEITKNIKVVEWLKADLINSTAALYKGMLRNKDDQWLDALASIIITCYVLSGRLGAGFSRLEIKIEAKLRQGIEQEHEMEKWYKDLSGLLGHLVNKTNF